MLETHICMTKGLANRAHVKESTNINFVLKNWFLNFLNKLNTQFPKQSFYIYFTNKCPKGTCQRLPKTNYIISNMSL